MFPNTILPTDPPQVPAADEQPTQEFAPVHPLDGVFHDDGTADDSHVPTGAPILTCGTVDAHWVPKLITGLNDALDGNLPIGTAVTPDVIAAVSRLRAAHEVPIETQIVDAKAHVTPNVWATLNVLTDAIA